MDITNRLGVPQETLDAEIKSFFESAPPLKNSDDISEKLKKFIERNSLSLGKFTLLFTHMDTFFKFLDLNWSPFIIY